MPNAFAFLFANAFRWSVRWSAGGLFHFLIFGHYEMATLSVGECALINATNCTHTIFNGVESGAGVWVWDLW